MTDTPVTRLRELHRRCSCWGENCGGVRPNVDANSHCAKCIVTWPCDLIAALDALEEGIESARRHMYALNKAVADERDKTRSLQVRLDAATVLIEVVRDQQGTEAKPDDVFVPSISWDRWGKILDALAIVDRAWLAGDKEEHGEL